MMVVLVKMAPLGNMDSQDMGERVKAIFIESKDKRYIFTKYFIKHVQSILSQ